MNGDKQKFVNLFEEALKEASSTPYALDENDCKYDNELEQCKPYDFCTLKQVPKNSSQCIYNEKLGKCEPDEYCNHSIFGWATGNKCKINKEAVKKAQPKCILKDKVIKNTEIKYCPQYITNSKSSLQETLAQINQKYSSLSKLEDVFKAELQGPSAEKLQTIKYNAMDLVQLGDLISQSSTKKIETICPHISLMQKIETGTMNVLKIVGSTVLAHPQAVGGIANMLVPGSGTFVSKGLSFLGQL